ncbi:SIR2 family protein [Pseudorhodoferax sp. Leaf274]|uniref:SIR2 family protein n=1 Tax=Pseudorhodoferax sp. Leaf274 TaxID=1736318 RepID=UPI0019105154|nr:SIR2 family protein [Pseudorhodoferax sp. Leaf274]
MSKATDAATPTAPAEATTSVKSLLPVHDAAQQARNLRQVLQDDKQRIGCLLGAGCPLGVYDAEGRKSVVLIPAIIELTKRIAAGLQAADSAAGPTSKLKASWDSLCAECKPSDSQDPTVEDVLTELRTLSSRRGTAQILGMTKQEMRELDDKVCALISAEMRKPLPTYRNSYNRFASWIGGVHRNSPAEIFTPNYDLLFEQALEQHPLPHFDGFVGSREPWFDLASIEHDAIPSRWTRLWKLHGSINWEKSEDTVGGNRVTRVVRVTREAAAGKVMIFPSHLKYDQSRRMPYLAMLDRLRAFFHGKDAPRLVVCGYSFLDDHLNEVLLDGLRGNRNAQCFALMYSGLNDHPRVVDYAERQGNLTVLAWDGAVVGTRVGGYRAGTTGGQEHVPWLEDAVPENDSEDARPRSRLGDFHYFGLFLEQLCGGGGHVTQPAV